MELDVDGKLQEPSYLWLRAIFNMYTSFCTKLYIVEGNKVDLIDSSTRSD